MSISQYCLTAVLLSSRKVLVLEDLRRPIFKSSSLGLKSSTTTLIFGLSCDAGLCYRAARRHSDVANVDRLLLAAATAEDDIYKLDMQSATTMRCRDIVELVGYSTGPPYLSADY